MFLLSLFALVAQPSLNSSVDHARLSAAADEVALALKYAQASAAGTGQACRVTFDDSAETLEVERLTSAADFEDGSLSEISRELAETVSFAPVMHPLKRGHDYTVDFSNDTGVQGVDILSAVFGSGGSITYGATGAPSDGGTVRLSRSGREVAVSVDGLSGKCTVSGL